MPNCRQVSEARVEAADSKKVSKPREKSYACHFAIINYLSHQRSGKRLQQIHQAVQNAGFKVVERTIRRDLAALQEGGVPVIAHEYGGSFMYKFDTQSWTGAPVVLDPAEALTLVLARNALNARNQSYFANVIDVLLQELASSRTQQFRQSLQSFEQSVFCQESEAEGANWCEPIMTAIHDEQKLRLRYRNATDIETRRVVAPIRLFITREQTYLIAFCYSRNMVLKFLLECIGKLEILGEQFRVTWDPELIEREWENVVGTVNAPAEEIEILFDNLLLRYFQGHKVHDSQKLIRQNDGACLMKLNVGINEPLLDKLLGLGHRIEVLKPVKLREIVQQRHQRKVECYSPEAAASATLTLEFK